MKYHINPETGRPNICRAQTPQSCLYYDAETSTEAPHFESKEEARKFFEKSSASETFTSFSKVGEKTLAVSSHPLAQSLRSIIEADKTWLPKHRRIPKDLSKLQDPKVSANICEHVSQSFQAISYLSPDYDGPKLGIVKVEPKKPFLNNHVANTFVENGETFVLDWSYSQIDDTVSLPYIAPIKEWRENVLKAAENPKESIHKALYYENGIPKIKNVHDVRSSPKVQEIILEDKEKIRDSEDEKFLEEVKEKYFPGGNFRHSGNYYFQITNALVNNPNSPRSFLERYASDKYWGSLQYQARNSLKKKDEALKTS